MRSTSHWRAGLVDKFMELLPEVQQMEIKSGKSSKISVNSGQVKVPTNCDPPQVQEQSLSSILLPSTNNSTVPQRDDSEFVFKPLVFGTPRNVGGTVNHSKASKYVSPSVHGRLFSNMKRVPKIHNSLPKNVKLQDTFSSRRQVSAMNVSPSEEVSWSSFRVLSNGQHIDNGPDKLSPDKGQNEITNQVLNTSPYSHRVTANPITTPGSKFSLFNIPSGGVQENGSGKMTASGRDNGTWNISSLDDPMDISSHGRQDSIIDVQHLNGAPRWRSDETSDEEEPSTYRGPSLVRHKGTASGTRRTRFSKR